LTRQLTLETQKGRAGAVRLKSSFVTDSVYAALAAIKQGVGYGIVQAGECGG
jgi:hypothetical protein